MLKSGQAVLSNLDVRCKTFCAVQQISSHTLLALHSFTIQLKFASSMNGKQRKWGQHVPKATRKHCVALKWVEMEHYWSSQWFLVASLRDD